MRDYIDYILSLPTEISSDAEVADPCLLVTVPVRQGKVLFEQASTVLMDGRNLMSSAGMLPLTGDLILGPADVFEDISAHPTSGPVPMIIRLLTDVANVSATHHRLVGHIDDRAFEISLNASGKIALIAHKDSKTTYGRRINWAIASFIITPTRRIWAENNVVLEGPITSLLADHASADREQLDALWNLLR